MSKPTDTTIAILAGGQSSRMGRDKSFVLLDEQPILQHVISRVRELELPVILLTNAPEAYARFGLPMFADVLPGKGSLIGLHSAMHHSETPYTFCVACDMPLLNVALLRHLIDLRQEADIIVPVVDGRPENLHAVYSKACLPVMRQQIETGMFKINRLHEKLTVYRVEETVLRRYDPGLRSFINVNTPEDLARIQQLK